MKTQDNIIKQTAKIFAQHGYEGISMSVVAEKSHIAKSVIYHYYKDKDVLLKEMFDSINSQLGKKRAKLPALATARERIKQIIRFQFEHAPEVVTILKYYAAFRKQFTAQEAGGYVPTKAYLHVEEVLEFGMKTQEFHISNLTKDAKVITHAINGFVLEYFPQIPKEEELDQLIEDIADFILRAIITNSQNRKGGEIK